MPKCLGCGSRNIFMKLNDEGLCIECQCKPFREMKNSAYVENMKNKNPAAKNADCPACGSANVRALGENKEAFSVGKAVGGMVLVGGIGALAGFAGKKNGYDVVCGDCGHRFLVK